MSSRVDFISSLILRDAQDVDGNKTKKRKSRRRNCLS